MNVQLHILVCLLMFKVTSALSSLPSYSRTSLVCNIPLIATLLFSVHPIHTEAVTGVVGRAELIASLFYLLAFYAYFKSTIVPFIKACTWFTLCLLFLLLALLSKEQGITAAGTCFAFEILCLMGLNLKTIKTTLIKLTELKSYSAIGKCSTLSKSWRKSMWLPLLYFSCIVE